MRIYREQIYWKRTLPLCFMMAANNNTDYKRQTQDNNVDGLI